MAGRSLVDQVFLLKKEVTAGTPVTTGMQQFAGLSLMPGHNDAGEDYRAAGFRVPTSHIPTDEWGAHTVTVSADYNALTPVAASTFGNRVTTQPDSSGAPTAYQHQFTIVGKGSNPRESFTGQWGDGTVAGQFSFFRFSKLGISVERDKLAFTSDAISREADWTVSLFGTNEVQTVTITGVPTGGTFTLTFKGATTTPIAYNAIASAVQSALEALTTVGTGNVLCAGGPLPATPVTVTFQGALARTDVPAMTTGASFTGGTSPAVAVTTTTPGASAAVLPAVPMAPRSFDVYVDSSWANLGTTQYLSCYHADFNIGDLWQPDTPINSSITSFDSLVEGDAVAYTGSAHMGLDASAVSLVSTYKAGTLKYIRIVNTGGIIASTTHYKFQLDFVVQLTKRGTISKSPNSSTVTLPFDYITTVDPVTGNSAQMTLVNTVATL